MATYLQIINRVLTVLREPEVGSATESPYSRLIGAFVNDAKEYVEDSFRWSTLHENISTTTTASQSFVTLTGTTERTVPLEVYSTDRKCRLWKADRNWVQRERVSNPNYEAEPEYWFVDGYEDNGQVRIGLFPTPDSNSYNLEFFIFNPQPRLTNGSDPVKVDTQSVYFRAWAMAISERGEDGGQLYAEVDRKADLALRQAISTDVEMRVKDSINAPKTTDWATEELFPTTRYP